MIEAGYDPPPYDLGWMGHYLLVRGFDNMRRTINTNYSYDGENLEYTYDHIEEFWSHFNNVYIVLYDILDLDRVFEILGEDADETVNLINTLEKNQAAVTADRSNAHQLFNLGTTLVELGYYEQAAVAYDSAFNAGLPWRMMWYQFGPFEAYNAVGRYGDTIALAQANLNDGGGQYVEETFYYAGIAREGLGEFDRALNNYNSAIAFNPNFNLARAARDALNARLSS
jgi:tetratricopeptide (TPR) repeat protein